MFEQAIHERFIVDQIPYEWLFCDKIVCEVANDHF